MDYLNKNSLHHINYPIKNICHIMTNACSFLKLYLNINFKERPLLKFDSNFHTCNIIYNIIGYNSVLNCVLPKTSCISSEQKTMTAHFHFP